MSYDSGAGYAPTAPSYDAGASQGGYAVRNDEWLPVSGLVQPGVYQPAVYNRGQVASYNYALRGAKSDDQLEEDDEEEDDERTVGSILTVDQEDDE